MPSTAPSVIGPFPAQGSARSARCNGQDAPRFQHSVSPFAAGTSRVVLCDGRTGAELYNFFAFDPFARSGVTVACADLNGDGLADLVAGSGPGQEPRVRAFSGQDTALLADVPVYDASLTGGVRVALADATGDGTPDFAVTPGPGGGAARLFDGRDHHLVAELTPLGPHHDTGLYVAACGPSAWDPGPVPLSGGGDPPAVITVSFASGGGEGTTPAGFNLLRTGGDLNANLGDFGDASRKWLACQCLWPKWHNV